jgi:GTP-binding protein
MSEIRNIAIIAHVDHGKTTLVDNMLKQSGIFDENEVATMDCNDLERERGITILAKCTSMTYEGVKYNIIDTPGHADFGGEVERVLSMVDGAILLVDAAEGPMPQTKFVLSKALKIGLKPIVVINKVDRSDRRVKEVLDEVFELFMSLDATDAQLDFPILYGSGRAGWVTTQYETIGENLAPMFEIMKSHVPPPNVDTTARFSMLASILGADAYVGRLLIGKIYSGVAKIGMAVKGMSSDGKTIETTKLTKLFGFRGLDRFPIETAEAGDIVAIAGVKETSVADTICDPELTEPIAALPIDPPTMALTITANNSPLAGTEGTKVTSRMILERLQREAETNVAIRLTVSPTGESYEVGGRGELQLGVLVENMRREGFELLISRPQVLYKKDENGDLLEPIEEVVIDVDEAYCGVIVEKLLSRKGELKDMRMSSGGKSRMIFHVPSRGLIGYQGEFRQDTRGTGVLNRIFHSYEPFKGSITSKRNGVLVSNSGGEAVSYALWNLEERGMMFIPPKTKVYEGMIIGEHNRDNDLDVNPIKGKQLTNVRASGSDEAIQLTPHKPLKLEETLAYIQDDELVEVTPQSIRLRKKFLNPSDRKKAAKTSA